MRIWRRAKALVLTTTGLFLAFMALQTIPIWNIDPVLDPRNPPVRYTVDWALPEADHIMHTLCYTCHSNETRYPIYMRMAPLSWIAAQHVNQGRAHLNFSEQPLDTIDPLLLIAMIRADAMPPQIYRLAHPEANLTQAQKQQLIEGILATYNRVNVQARYQQDTSSS